jgi:hypothetical protein
VNPIYPRKEFKHKEQEKTINTGGRELLLDALKLIGIIIIIQFNSILYYLCAESTATRPITDTAQYRYT